MEAKRRYADMMARYAGGELLVQTRSDVAERSGDGEWKASGSGAWHTYRPGGDPNYHLRSVLPWEIVLDIGDDGNWARCVKRTHALWIAMNRLNVAGWGALSGGRGTHTHVFGPKRTEESSTICANCFHAPKAHSGDVRACGEVTADVEAEFSGPCRCVGFEALNEHLDWRNFTASAIIEVALQILGDPLDQEFCDWRLLAPTRHMARDFGGRKTALGHEKTLWCQLPGFFMPLPADRDEAYRQADLKFPEKKPVQNDNWLVRRIDYDAICTGTCPKGPQCLLPQGPEVNFGSCENCPLLGD